MIDKIQIIAILNGLKNWVIKWSGQGKGNVYHRSCRQTQNYHPIHRKITPKYESVEVVQLYKTSGKMAKCYSLVRYFQSLTIFEATLAVLQLAFSILNLPV